MIDTYNVLHVTGVFPPSLAGLDARGLGELVAAHGLGQGGTAVLVCDGAGPGDSLGPRVTVAPGVELLYAGSGGDADSTIERLLEESTAPRGLVVVSSDRRVQRAARSRRAKTMEAEEFARRLVARATSAGRPSGAPASRNALREQVPLDAYSTASWMKLFGYDANDLIASAGAARAMRHEPTSDDPRDDPNIRDRQSRERMAKTRHGERGASLPPAPAKPAAPNHAPPRDAPTDRLLAEALRAWEGRLSLEDLDMERWLGGVIKRPRE